MARILDTSNATAVVVQPVKAETLNFMQTAASARTNSILSSIYGVPVPSNATLYVLSGCVVITIGSTVNVTNGVVWYNGEVFDVPSATFSAPTNPNIIIFTLVTDYDTNNADPLTFSDQIQRNVHQIRTLNVTTGTSATTGYVFDFSAAIFQNLSLPALSTSITNEVNRAIGVEQGLSTRISNEVIRATNAEAAIGTVWSTELVTSSNLIVDVGSGSISAIAGRIDYSVIGKTVTAIVSAVFTVTGVVNSVNLTMPAGVTWSGYDFATSGYVANFPDTVVDIASSGNSLAVFAANNSSVLRLSSVGASVFNATSVICRFNLSAQIA